MLFENSTFRDCLETADLGSTKYRISGLYVDNQSLPFFTNEQKMDRFVASANATLSISGEWFDSTSQIRLGVVHFNRNEFPDECDRALIERFIRQKLVETTAERMFNAGNCRPVAAQNTPNLFETVAKSFEENKPAI